MSDVLTLRLDDGLLERLEAVAKRTNISKSEVVRKSILAYLEQQHGPRAETMLKLAGSVDGPALAATNANIRRAIRRKAR